jgi:hypothetical protein
MIKTLFYILLITLITGVGVSIPLFLLGVHLIKLNLDLLK